MFVFLLLLQVRARGVLQPPHVGLQIVRVREEADGDVERSQPAQPAPGGELQGEEKGTKEGRNKQIFCSLITNGGKTSL